MRIRSKKFRIESQGSHATVHSRMHEGEKTCSAPRQKIIKVGLDTEESHCGFWQQSCCYLLLHNGFFR